MEVPADGDARQAGHILDSLNAELSTATRICRSLSAAEGLE